MLYLSQQSNSNVNTEIESRKKKHQKPSTIKMEKEASKTDSGSKSTTKRWTNSAPGEGDVSKAELLAIYGYCSVRVTT